MKCAYQHLVIKNKWKRQFCRPKNTKIVRGYGLGSSGSEYGSGADICGHDNEPSDSGSISTGLGSNS
jgi:hypothetical protein